MQRDHPATINSMEGMPQQAANLTPFLYALKDSYVFRAGLSTAPPSCLGDLQVKYFKTL
jgi:hypothetical protein